MSAVRDLIERVTHKRGISASEDLAYFTPRMEMYGIPREEIIRLVEEHGGKIVKVEPDGWAGYDWSSFTYYVVKS